MIRPFLTIVTRCCQRPEMLSLNIQSVLRQIDQDAEQVFIVDKERIGVAEANKIFGKNTHRIKGEWVYILDDDTRLVEEHFVSEVKKAVHRRDCDVLMVKSARPQFAPHVLPKEQVWGKPEKMKVATTNCLCYLVRRNLWKENVHYFGRPAAGDWWFLKSLRDMGCSFEWLNMIVAETQQLGRGRLFEECSSSWFQDVVEEYGIEEKSPGDFRLSFYSRKVSRNITDDKPKIVFPVSKPPAIRVTKVYQRVPEIAPVQKHSLLNRGKITK